MTRIVTLLGVLLLVLSAIFYLAQVGSQTAVVLLVILGALAIGLGALTGR